MDQKKYDFEKVPPKITGLGHKLPLAPNKSYYVLQEILSKNQIFAILKKIDRKKIDLRNIGTRQ